MNRLIALDLPGGADFVLALRRCWDQGDAVVVLDPRLPAISRTALIEAARPHHAITAADADLVPLDPGAPPVEAGDALVVTTSGSTGEPKVLVHTHDSLQAHATAVHEHLAVDPARDRWLATLPLNHLGGFGVVARSVLTGTPVDVQPAFDPAVVAAAADRFGTTLVSLVATALDRLDPAPFRWVVLGGSADPVIRPANVVHTYGLTETGGGVVYDGSPLPGVEVRIDGAGQIAIRSATTARGRRSATGEIASLVDADGWLATGDLGSWGSDGRLTVEGRADDLIVTGGENVWPGPVEDVLRTHPGVADVAVVGEPDPEWGQRVVALVVPATPTDAPSLEDLRQHVKAQLPAYAAPRELRLTDAIERTSLGKVVRR
ncbi:class I adenylate-forming enzyme family protein [Aquihabitans daechungensis]|uniref:class I adenylate-forming enzyme family protein n=1 Tax=Aquihabitans daechungensis TaxID=1052257 RepID=UPI003BA258FD